MIVGRHMTKDPVVIRPADLLSLAQERMKKGEFRRLPVVHEGKLIGILTEAAART